MDRPASQSRAFDIYRTLSKGETLSLSQAFKKLIDLAVASISAGRQQEAVSTLNQLKECIEEAKSIIDGKPDLLMKHLMDVKVLQYENCKLKLELARLQNNEEDMYVYQELLKQFDQFFSSGIASLD